MDMIMGLLNWRRQGAGSRDVLIELEKSPERHPQRSEGPR